MIKREMAKSIIDALKAMPAVTITGPRQSGKTTLVKNLLPGYKYINLEDLEIRAFALDDPKGFLKTAGQKAIFDEIQHVPQLFSYLQVEIDATARNGMYVLTGSNNFLLMQSISQSLAGRVAIFHLLPFSQDEIYPTVDITLEEVIHKGFYPRLFQQIKNYHNWYADYISTYIEKDVRRLINVGDINSFRDFLKLCAARTGQLINFSEIGNELSVSYQTVKRWLSVLETGYILFRLNPYSKNLNKRIVKSSKIYFYDTGLLCYLLGIKTPEDLQYHYLRGFIFESYVIAELKKYICNRTLNADTWFYRDSNGNEVDVIIEAPGMLKAIEIKSGKTIVKQFFKGLNYWHKVSGNEKSEQYLIYAGDDKQMRSDSIVLNWHSISEIFNKK
ncbi:MAG: ATP-binding protein [Chlorobi bacterium]|nr:ATP-binding protein [Chlorobiota bacterium]